MQNLAIFPFLAFITVGFHSFTVPILGSRFTSFSVREYPKAFMIKPKSVPNRFIAKAKVGGDHSAKDPTGMRNPTATSIIKYAP